MTIDTWIVFATVIVAALLFASDRLRLDLVALLVVLALTLSGVLTAEEAFAGFGSPVVILVVGLMVLGEALTQTGVAQAIGARIADIGGGSWPKTLLLIMLFSALLSSVMSSTAVVAIFIPIIFKIAKQSGIGASRLLLPMSYAAMISGMLTLIATMPNLVVSNSLVAAGYQPLSFFSFSPVGICVLGIAMLYLLFFGQGLLSRKQPDATGSPARTLQQLWDEFAYEKMIESLKVESDSPLCGISIEEAQIETRFQVRILAVTRPTEMGGYGPIENAAGKDRIESGMLLLVTGEAECIQTFAVSESLQLVPRSNSEKRRRLQVRGAAVIMIHPDCRFLGKSIHQAKLRDRYEIHVIGMRRDGKLLDKTAERPLKAADLLLISGPWDRIAAMAKDSRDFVLLEMPSEYKEAKPAFRRAPIALSLLGLMVLVCIAELLPVSIAVVIAAIAAVGSKCLTAEEAYRSVSWSSIVLLAGMLPVARALEKTGGTELLVNQVVSGLGDIGPQGMMTILFALSAGLSLVLSNTATAVLLAPVAIQVAHAMEVSPYPLAVTVLIGASSAFASPVASPVVTLVVEPGKYNFKDFLYIGTPLIMVAYLTNLWLTPVLFPFGG